VKTVVKVVCGYCPEQDKYNWKITIKTVELPGYSGYKKMGYQCPYCDDHDCQVAGTDGRGCPLYRDA
jgi:hypothetical protein